MKKTSLLIGTALIFGAHAATAAEDYACATPPSCAELGYNQTVNDCAGKKMIKCPFDTAKVFCGETTKDICEAKGYYRGYYDRLVAVKATSLGGVDGFEQFRTNTLDKSQLVNGSLATGPAISGRTATSYDTSARGGMVTGANSNMLGQVAAGNYALEAVYGGQMPSAYTSFDRATISSQYAISSDLAVSKEFLATDNALKISDIAASGKLDLTPHCCFGQKMEACPEDSTYYKCTGKCQTPAQNDLLCSLQGYNLSGPLAMCCVGQTRKTCPSNSKFYKCTGKCQIAASMTGVTDFTKLSESQYISFSCMAQGYNLSGPLATCGLGQVRSYCPTDPRYYRCSGALEYQQAELIDTCASGFVAANRDMSLSCSDGIVLNGKKSFMGDSCYRCATIAECTSGTCIKRDQLAVGLASGQLSAELSADKVDFAVGTLRK